MPVYGYRCKSCNHTFEVIQSVKDDPIKNCPECNGEVGKIFFPIGISFKGSGFYATDYKSSKNGAAEKPSVGAPAKDGNGGSRDGNGSGCSSCASVKTFGGDS